MYTKDRHVRLDFKSNKRGFRCLLLTRMKVRVQNVYDCDGKIPIAYWLANLLDQ